MFAIENADLAGPVNFLTDHPVTQKELVRSIAKAMHRPALGSVPKAVAALMFGAEKAREIFFAGQRARPKALLDAGFRFAHPELAPYLRSIL